MTLTVGHVSLTTWGSTGQMLCRMSLVWKRSGKHLHKLFGVLLHGRFVYFPCLFISLIIICISKESCIFISYFGSWSNTTLFCSTYSSLGYWELFQWVPGPLWPSPITGFCYFFLLIGVGGRSFKGFFVCSFIVLFVFGSPLFSSTTRYSRLILCISCPPSRISHFSKRSGSFS